MPVSIEKLVLTPRLPPGRRANTGRRTALPNAYSAIWRTVLPLILGTSLAAQAPAPPRDPARAVDSLFAQWNKPGSPGCAVGVIQDGRWIHQAGYGTADLSTGAPITPNTRFYMGSVSKQFAAASIALAVKQGKLSLDDPLRKWIPEFPEYAQAITVRNLVHHTSGVRDYLVLLALNGHIGDVHPDSEVLKLLARQTALDFAPGSEYSYSNSGYFLLSVILERATGLSLKDFAQKNLFGPLGMRNSYFYDDHTQPHPAGPLAMGYAPKDNGYDKALYPNFEQVADGGLYSTLNDLMAWDQNFYQPKVGDQAFLELIQTPGKLSDGRPLEYGFGLIARDYGGLRTIVHSGAFMGYRTMIQRFPDQRWTAVMLCNLYTMSPETLALRIADIYLADALDRAQADLVGTYWSDELTASWRIESRNGRLTVIPDAGPPVTLVSQGKGKYQHSGGLGPATMTFAREGTRVTGFTIDAGRARGLRFVRR
jgi:CubicO group peptidase (beta-lactamase class C family)